MNNINTKKDIGKAGESAACSYLRLKGHTILGRNIRLKTGEIDILSSINDVIHVVEVKTATFTKGSDFGKSKELLYDPEDNFSNHKLKKLRILAREVQSSFPHHAMFQLGGMLLRDGNATDPDIQIDGLAIRLLIDRGLIKKARVKYFPYIA